MNKNPFYTTYSQYLSGIFPNCKVQKLSLNANLSCPNRDGFIGSGGCIYCNNASFNPSYCQLGTDISNQIKAGRDFFGRKYPDMKYLAYFQAYTGSHGKIEKLLSLYHEALSCEGIVGLIIGTRPDCMPDYLLKELAKINSTTPVIIEFGAESMHDTTLSFINRRHTSAQTVDAVRRTAEAGISCGLHLIAGLPGETHDDIIETVRKCCKLPIDTLKIHQLQIICNTELARLYESDDIGIHIMELDEYINLCIRIITEVPRHIAIERFVSQCPPELLIAPKWGLKNYQFVNLLHKRMTESCKDYPSIPYP